ncbi:unnamed protein product [Nyctereutes procyonoides]|uniref:(raccoon dog) hypothetical protein n=1 Tax=Nyctereutes procyonoides TaxID=34880 RepID=A0A811ZYJ2_NYCPR|nr:unnamed protein product [Nyctereutes procyonoides]
MELWKQEGFVLLCFILIRETLIHLHPFNEIENENVRKRIKENSLELMKLINPSRDNTGSGGLCPSEGSREGSFSRLPASSGFRCSLACGCIPPVSASVFTGPLPLCLCLPFLIKTLVAGFRGHLGNPE